MFDDFVAYYEENVVSEFIAYTDIRTTPTAGRSQDIRAALAAASALFHVREHLPAPYGMTRAEVEALCPEYALLGDIVNVSKHAILTTPTPHGAPLVDQANKLSEVVEITEYRDDKGIFRHAEKRVIVELKDRTELDVLDVLTATINFWDDFLASKGLIQSARDFSTPKALPTRSSENQEAAYLNLAIQLGVRVRQNLRIKRFNYATAVAEPVDLSGASAIMRVYRVPNFTLRLSITRESDGTEYVHDVSLSDEESDTLGKLPEVERGNYLQNLQAVKDAMLILAAQAKLVKPNDHDNAGN